MANQIARSAASELHRLEAVEALLRAQATAHIVELGRVREQITTLRVSMSADDLRRYETLAVVFELDRISNVRGAPTGVESREQISTQRTISTGGGDA